MLKKYIILIIRWGLALFFIYAAHSKIINAAQFSAAIRAYDILPPSLSALPAIFMPWIELFAAIFLMIGLYTRSAAGILFSLMLVFTIMVAVALFRGLEIDCGCGASLAGIEKVSWLKVFENLFIILCTYILTQTKTFFLSLDNLRISKD
ncbi:MAG: DoxX family membrane protein [Calditrichae bacterium]|nr:DoxX family membrane protein [Calditrichota bacterium]MCB9059172.1 DoxX family membrane protein [Calditrichia bacterium]